MILQLKYKVIEYENKLEFLDFEMSREMQKPIYERKFRVLEFLYKEIAVYQFALNEMKDLIEKPLYDE